MLSGIDRASALIVGATQGIGLGFVKALLQQKNVERVFATYRHSATAEELFTLQKQYGDRLQCIQVDITQESQIAEGVKQIQELTKQLHLAIYCVGVLHEGNLSPEKSLRQINADNLIYSFQVNSIGAVLLAKHLMPLFNKSQRSIFASISAKVGSIGDNRLGGWYGYRASKSALNMFLKTTAIEYSRRCPKTIVVALHPGTTDTRLSQPFQKNVPPGKLFPVAHTVDLLSKVIASLEQKDSGEFFSWDGSRLPW
ncbi:SDR family NAD(P)-dependent oxidoreductase [Waterburya agarophytonicola K14]|uniref:SDR family NAD(P)-dependent oxidoreductase n=1 Tax=Waterburya agarophytonicola KI4 TaxID=2874699 RepID=A0A964FIL1_9CYAN|nr:SDR family NAD(P)-dependent oxidoreductase [Waterburya agarophytonicola]MCC0178559.1 SDR family NAD(P)-dependent oxidoreductase [Waterburya agarophytonicola KI4]